MFSSTGSITDEPISFTSSPRQMTLELPGATFMSIPLLDIGSSKRKRAFEVDEVSFRSISSPYSGSIALSTPALSSSDSFYDVNDNLRPQPHPLQRNTSSDSRNSKRLHLTPRLQLPRHISAHSSDIVSLPSIASPTTTIQACHICSRRPSTIQDLPAYNDCDTCNKRTCFICMRTCEGPRCQSTAHTALGFPNLYSVGKKICSRCCTEVGSDGTVWCKTCYEDDSELEAIQKGNKEQLQVESEGRVAEWLSRFDGPEDMDLEMDTEALYQQFLGF